MSRTNIDIDDELAAEVMRRFGLSTKKAAVDLALRTRSVHVTAGLGTAVVGGLVHPWVGVLGLLAWISMANTKPEAAKIAK